MGQLIGFGFAIAAVGYLLGSFPTGFLLTKSLTGLDIREQGSGSTGATNVLRTVGKGAGATVLIVDAAKGAIAVAVALSAPTVLAIPEVWQPWFVVLSGLAAILGHSKPVWLGFRGGKSVATGIGVILTLNPFVGLGALAMFGVMLGIWRIVSLGSIMGAITVMVLMVVLQQPLAYCVLGAIAGLYVIIRHQANIQRLLAGTEPQIGRKLATEPATEVTEG